MAAKTPKAPLAAALKAGTSSLVLVTVVVLVFLFRPGASGTLQPAFAFPRVLGFLAASAGSAYAWEADDPALALWKRLLYLAMVLGAWWFWLFGVR